MRSRKRASPLDVTVAKAGEEAEDNTVKLKFESVSALDLPREETEHEISCSQSKSGQLDSAGFSWLQLTKSAAGNDFRPGKKTKQTKISVSVHHSYVYCTKSAELS